MEIKAAGRDHQRLRTIAKKLLEKAADGDMQAINCLADRLDGRPFQQMEIATDAQPFALIPQNIDNPVDWERAFAPKQVDS
jgi:hypothetical protein